MKIYLIAVEPSADKLGADLAEALRAARPDVSLAGIGGRRMQSVGVPSQMDIDELAILGITEALKKLPYLKPLNPTWLFSSIVMGLWSVLRSVCGNVVLKRR